MPDRGREQPVDVRVAEHLTRSILTGARRPGEHLVAEDVATELSVSRFSVREALRTLDGGGLVDIRPRRGAFVATVDDADTLAEIVETRAALEPRSAERAAHCRDTDDLAALTEALDAGSVALAAGRRAEVGLAHHRYLRALSLAAHHRTLDDTLAPLQHRTMLAFAVLRFRVEPGGWASHLAVRDAIACRDGDRARTLVAHHLARVVEAVREPGNLTDVAIRRSSPTSRPERHRRARLDQSVDG